MPVHNGDVVRITCTMRQSLSDVQNVYHALVDATSTIDNTTFFTQMADDIDSMYDPLVTNLPDQLTFDSISMQNLTQEEFIGQGAWPVKTDGSAVSHMLPPQCAALCLFSTDTLRSQGRKFLPPLTVNSEEDDGSITAATLTAIASFIAECLLTKNGTNWSAVLGNYNPTLARFATWIEGTARDLFATQRRRYTGYGS